MVQHPSATRTPWRESEKCRAAGYAGSPPDQILRHERPAVVVAYSANPRCQRPFGPTWNTAQARKPPLKSVTSGGELRLRTGVTSRQRRPPSVVCRTRPTCFQSPTAQPTRGEVMWIVVSAGGRKGWLHRRLWVRGAPSEEQEQARSRPRRPNHR